MAPRKKKKTVAGPGFAVHALNLTSQTWLTPADFVGPVGHTWWHTLMVIVPDLNAHPGKASFIRETPYL